MSYAAPGHSTQTQTTSIFALGTLTSLFFMWGFITSLNDILIPHLKALFDLSYTQAMLVQSCFFGAYFLVSLPAGWLVNRIGYQKGIGAGLLIAAVGCLLFIPSAKFAEYWMFLTALFILASGITVLQVAANPLVTIMGPPETASSRLSMTQAFNSVGTTIAPIIGGYLLFSAVSNVSAQVEADSVILPYLALACTLVTIAVIMIKIPLPTPASAKEEPEAAASPDASIFAHRHLVLGAIGIFAYVGAEVAIGSLMVNYFGSEHVLSLSEQQASYYLAFYWGGAMVGRFIGAAVMQKLDPGKCLVFCSIMSCTLICVSVFSSGTIAMWTLLAVGLCNSIMFPTIFSLALDGLGKHTAKGSGLLCLAIVGGAVVPIAQGSLADNFGIQLSFLLPLFCYAYILFYGVKGHKQVSA